MSLFYRLKKVNSFAHSIIEKQRENPNLFQNLKAPNLYYEKSLSLCNKTSRFHFEIRNLTVFLSVSSMYRSDVPIPFNQSKNHKYICLREIRDTNQRVKVTTTKFN